MLFTDHFLSLIMTYCYSIYTNEPIYWKSYTCINFSSMFASQIVSIYVILDAIVLPLSCSMLKEYSFYFLSNMNISIKYFFYLFKVYQSDDMGKLKNIRQLFPVTKRPGKHISILPHISENKYT